VLNNRSFLRTAILVLAAITAIIHFVRAPGAGIPFVLNGIGFLALAALVVVQPAFLAGREALVRYALIAFSIVTILAWVVLGDKSLPEGWMGYVAKIDELLLIAATWAFGRLTPGRRP